MRALIVGSSLVVLAVSAAPGNASAAEILPQSDPEIFSLGSEMPTFMGIGSFMGQRLVNPILGNNAEEEDDQVDHAFEEEPEPEFVDGGGGNENPGTGQQPLAVSEPGMLGLFGAGLVALGLIRRRRLG